MGEIAQHGEGDKRLLWFSIPGYNVKIDFKIK